MHIGIIGAGGVGGYFGAKLCRHNADVSFIARGDHLKAIMKNGITVRTSSEGVITCRPSMVTDDVSNFPPPDVCLICVKSYDLPPILAKLNRAVHESTIMIPLLNGIDIHDRIRAVIQSGFVLPACVYIGTHIVEPGVISQEGGACKILFGPDPGRPNASLETITALFDRSRVKYERLDDGYPAVWTKFIFIASFGLVTACFSKTLGQVMESKKLSGYVRSVMEEIHALAEAKGILLPESIVSDSYGKGKDFPFETKTSFQRDYEIRDKNDERDLFAGTIIRMGNKFRIQTPVVRELSDRINEQKPLRAGLQE